MIIYWFGFVDELVQEDANILILEDFPTRKELTTLPALPLLDSLMKA